MRTGRKNCRRYLKIRIGLASALSLIFALNLCGAEHRDVGLTSSGARIQAAIVAGPSAASPTVLVVAGLTGKDDSVRAAEQEIQRFEAVRQDRRQFQLIVITLANPDASRLQFPPVGIAYRENAESHALWRWIGIHAPDLVIVLGAEDFGLAEALSKNVVAGTGRIPARRLDSKARILQSLPKEIPVSEAHREIDRRVHRTGRQLAAELAEVYGHDFNSPTYIPGMALIGQLRLGRTDDVARLAAPYTDGSKNLLDRANSLTLAGHLVFAELAERTEDARYTALVRKAAELGFTETGEMKESM